MHFHKWKEYKNKLTGRYYRICTKCGIAQKLIPSCGSLDTDYWQGNEYLCRTNNWVDINTYTLRYGKEW